MEPPRNHATIFRGSGEQIIGCFGSSSGSRDPPRMIAKSCWSVIPAGRRYVQPPAPVSRPNGQSDLADGLYVALQSFIDQGSSKARRLNGSLPLQISSP
jgi:hypothetical protein